ncbi:MAG: outer membrane beta-barrel protein [Burkholderiaceae bacterium]|jgi:outer membrane protein|nr:outer membrane beta-barrel protein [Burkholderiaceae bacterium]
MKTKLLLTAAVCALTAVSASAQTAEGSWLVRARAVHLDSANKDSTGLGLTINNKWLPEVDFTYFLNSNLAAELILTVPQKHKVYSFGSKIGTLKHLPPTLTVQYHFTNLGALKPYVGAGVNYTRFSAVHVLDGVATVKKNSFGPALQAGLDFAIAPNVYLNLDVKKVWIKTDVKAGGVKVGRFKVDPVLVGLGVGYRF